MNDDVSSPDQNEPRKSSALETGCMFIGGVIGGFIVFLVVGVIALSIDMGIFRRPAVIVIYLLASLYGAIWLTTKPSSRGFAIGVFLGLGAILLLASICGHTGPIAP